MVRLGFDDDHVWKNEVPGDTHSWRINKGFAWKYGLFKIVLFKQVLVAWLVVGLERIWKWTNACNKADDMTTLIDGRPVDTKGRTLLDDYKKGKKFHDLQLIMSGDIHEDLNSRGSFEDHMIVLDMLFEEKSSCVVPVSFVQTTTTADTRHSQGLILIVDVNTAALEIDFHSKGFDDDHVWKNEVPGDTHSWRINKGFAWKYGLFKIVLFKRVLVAWLVVGLERIWKWTDACNKADDMTTLIDGRPVDTKGRL
ncbi:hypothetical protein Tco_0519630 [Tanacetum coccineum]